MNLRRRSFRAHRAAVAVITLSCLASFSANAELAALELPGDDNSTIVYPASFFAPYSPTSANDMIDRIPGVSLSGGGGGRGLGTGGDLLINGQRIAGKDNSPSAQLSRIAAREVERIEIIRGTSGDLDVRGSGQVVNVVLQEAHSRSSTSVEVVADRHHDGEIRPGGSISHSRQIGDFQALLNLQAEPQYRHQTRREFNYDPGMNLIESLDETDLARQTAYELSATTSYRTGAHRMQLNLLYSESGYPRDIYRDISRPAGDDAPQRLGENELIDYDQHNWEVGGDYDLQLNRGGRVQFLFIVNDQTRDSVRERFATASPAETEDSNKLLFVDSAERTRERIAQASYSWRLTSGQDIQLGVERAHLARRQSLCRQCSRDA